MAVLKAEEPRSAETVQVVGDTDDASPGETAPSKVEASMSEAVVLDLPVSVVPQGQAEAANGSAAETVPLAKPEPRPEPVAVVLTPIDPDRPKRAGWWSRTKAALTGE
ncbi:hypothetical protein [uncultured Methylobacterium sp.]|uniref:hypothetical protein n=1 Tax=uncultured Methylobacterium sp. TaxID=157278 RepID=UPI0035CB8704